MRIGPLKKAAECLCWALMLGSGLLPSKAGEKRTQPNGLVTVPLGLPDILLPAADPSARVKVELGKQLFFDRRLSRNEALSCASCHVPERAFSDDVPLSRGLDGVAGKRNTPALLNLALQPYLFWDGRSSSLEDQALRPLENSDEMGSPIETVLFRLNRIPSYQKAFRAAFNAEATAENLAQALASFERTILAGNSPYDRYLAGEKGAMPPKAVEGMKLFNGQGHCHLCHQGHSLSDGLFHNLGVGWDGQNFADQGRFGVTGIVKDKGAFKTPTLRQIAQTAPYMHDGSLPTLEVVVEFYARGGKPNPHLDSLIQPRRLSVQEKEALVEFLKCLTGDVTFY
jgi:cytochrome c peroxidase